jgi:hypothetical protein
LIDRFEFDIDASLDVRPATSGQSEDIDGASSASAPRDFLAGAGFAGEQDRRRQARDACNGFTHAAPGR